MSRWWLIGGYGPLQWYQRLIGPRLWAATISLVWRCYYGDGGRPEKIQPADPIPSLPHSRIERRQLSPGANRPAARRRPRAPSAASVGGAQIRRALTRASPAVGHRAPTRRRRPRVPRRAGGVRGLAQPVRTAQQAATPRDAVRGGGQLDAWPCGCCSSASGGGV
jgi:hypothetical protein